MQKTYTPKESDIKRNWHEVNVNGKILGRVASEIAVLLTGKKKPYFVRHLDCGDYVVVTETEKIKVTGKKLTTKTYDSFSGYPGGLKQELLKDLLHRKPEEVIRHAVSGMLPKNKLRDQYLKRLYIYVGTDHPYKEKIGK